MSRSSARMDGKRNEVSEMARTMSPSKWKWRREWVGRFPGSFFRLASPDGRYEIRRRRYWWDVVSAGNVVAQVKSARAAKHLVEVMEDPGVLVVDGRECYGRKDP